MSKAKRTLRELVEMFPEVQLATLVEAPPQGDHWVHETKFDGYRLLGFASGKEALLRTRGGKDWTNSFPSIAAGLQALGEKGAVLDMEAVMVDAKGKTNFQELQAALGEGGDADAIVAYVFDLLYVDGEDLTQLPLVRRKEKLRAVLEASHQNALRYSEHTVGHVDQTFSNACKEGLEGIISKDARAPYTQGRSKSWLKTKCTLRQEFIILGSSSARSGDRSLGALYLGFWEDDVLHYAGKVGTGFTSESARDIQQRLQSVATSSPVLTRAEMEGLPAKEWQSIRWVNPAMLCEVAFTEWTQGGEFGTHLFKGYGATKMHERLKRRSRFWKKYDSN